MDHDDFELSSFTPYLLNQAAETQSHGFSNIYKDRYGMLRTEWRVLFHLGRYGALTAKQISERAMIHKTKISRAVHSLEQKRFLWREVLPTDRRVERLTLRPAGQEAFDTLVRAAAAYELHLERKFGRDDMDRLRQLLKQLANS